MMVPLVGSRHSSQHPPRLSVHHQLVGSSLSVTLPSSPSLRAVVASAMRRQALSEPAGRSAIGVDRHIGGCHPHPATVLSLAAYNLPGVHELQGPRGYDAPTCVVAAPTSAVRQFRLGFASCRGPRFDRATGRRLSSCRNPRRGRESGSADRTARVSRVRGDTNTVSSDPDGDLRRPALAGRRHFRRARSPARQAVREADEERQHDRPQHRREDREQDHPAAVRVRPRV